MTEPIANQVIFVIYAADQERSKNFYASVLGIEPVLHVPGMTEFQITETTKLGIMPESGIARIICPTMPHPESGTGIPRCEVYLYVPDPKRNMEQALEAGATLVSELASRDWGDEAGYVADLDGHILAFASRTA